MGDDPRLDVDSLQSVTNSSVASVRSLLPLCRRVSPARSAGAWLLALAAACASVSAAAQSGTCEGAERIRLRTPVTLEGEELAALRRMPPLRVTSVGAPPLSVYDEKTGSYRGIANDLLCFITAQVGMRFEYVPATESSVAQKIQLVQEGQLDVFAPLSFLPERERQGLFTLPFYDSYYVVIARKGRRLAIASTADLAQYRVGLVDGVALQPVLGNIVPPERMVNFKEIVTHDGLFEALRDDRIDVAVFNRDFFAEQRFRHELFDLEVVHTLREYPRRYRFYFSRSPQHQRVAAVFDRYLAVADTTLSLQAHEDGERQFIERYVRQRSQRTLLQGASVVAALLALASYLALRKYRALVRSLAQSHERILPQQQALQAANAELEQLSHTDALTRLANRRRLDEALAREHGRWQRTASPLSLLMIDLDHFKRVNDHYGHATGDDYLRAVAQVLARAAARPTDVAARYGGEEFVCLLPDTAPQEAAAVATRIHVGVAALALPNAHARPPFLTVSIGVATLAGGTHDAQDLLEAADAQLYAAKSGGRDQIRSVTLDDTDFG